MDIDKALNEVRVAFKHLNNYKRVRAKFETEKRKGRNGQYEELQMYKEFDQIELSLRGLQSELRGITPSTPENDNEEESE